MQDDLFNKYNFLSFHCVGYYALYTTKKKANGGYIFDISMDANIFPHVTGFLI
jgi:hypothetical protein